MIETVAVGILAILTTLGTMDQAGILITDTLQVIHTLTVVDLLMKTERTMKGTTLAMVTLVQGEITLIKGTHLIPPRTGLTTTGTTLWCSTSRAARLIVRPSVSLRREAEVNQDHRVS
uniref:Secreted protein n=1 Tax=Cacopsylla melanoneura TaxID=428564 RepID=A0A8D8R286_9HEMI